MRNLWHIFTGQKRSSPSEMAILEDRISNFEAAYSNQTQTSSTDGPKNAEISDLDKKSHNWQADYLLGKALRAVTHMDARKFFAISLIVVAAIFACMFRYDSHVASIGSVQIVWVVDRWSGSVFHCIFGNPPICSKRSESPQ